MTKSSEAVWGPIEELWAQVPAGATVEIWTFDSAAALSPSSHERTPGTTELYFVDGSSSVQGVGFGPEGVND